MERKYRIYKITSPSGKCYIGLTSGSVGGRWYQHAKKARLRPDYNHPFYNAIRKYGKDQFSVTELHNDLSLEKAMTKEVLEIAAIPRNLRYNISKGGEHDGAEGSKKFWAKVNSDPEYRERYIQKLKDSCTDRVFSEAAHAASKQWRKDNARIAYYNSHRAIRLATKAQNRPLAPKKEMNLKDRLLRKHKPNEFKRKYVTASWVNATEEQKAARSKAISKAQKERLSNLTEEQKRELFDRMKRTRQQNREKMQQGKWKEIRAIKH